MNRFIWTFVFAIVIAFAQAASSHAAVITVGPAGDHTTIQSAINAAEPGDTIEVAAGEYAEHVTITQSVVLLGPNAGISPNTGDRVDEAVIHGRVQFEDLGEGNGHDNVIIDGFKLTSGLSANGQGGQINLRRAGDNIIVANNWLTETVTDASYGYALGSGPAGDSTIRDGWVIDDNRISGFAATETGLKSTIQFWHFSNITVTNNVVEISLYAGVIFLNVNGAVITGNTFMNTPAHGLQFDGGGNALISDNNIVNANINAGSSHGGIRLPGNKVGPIRVTGNTVTGSYNGIFVRGATPELVTVAFNRVSGNTGVGIGGDFTSGNLDARLNWWGHRTGPAGGETDPDTGKVANGTGNTAGANVLFDPWMGKGGDFIGGTAVWEWDCTESPVITNPTSRIFYSYAGREPDWVVRDKSAFDTSNLVNGKWLGGQTLDSRPRTDFMGNPVVDLHWRARGAGGDFDATFFVNIHNFSAGEGTPIYVYLTNTGDSQILRVRNVINAQWTTVTLAEYENLPNELIHTRLEFDTSEKTLTTYVNGELKGTVTYTAFSDGGVPNNDTFATILGNQVELDYIRIANTRHTGPQQWYWDATTDPTFLGVPGTYPGDVHWNVRQSPANYDDSFDMTKLEEVDEVNVWTGGQTLDMRPMTGMADNPVAELRWRSFGAGTWQATYWQTIVDITTGYSTVMPLHLQRYEVEPELFAQRILIDIPGWTGLPVKQWLIDGLPDDFIVMRLEFDTTDLANGIPLNVFINGNDAFQTYDVSLKIGTGDFEPATSITLDAKVGSTAPYNSLNSDIFSTLLGSSIQLDYIRITNGEPPTLQPWWPVTGDANHDCAVNILDLIFVRNRIGQGVDDAPENWQADLNEDGDINVLDLMIVRENLNSTCD